jgi:hypothetical protein
MNTQWCLGPPPKAPIHGMSGFGLYFGTNLQDSVVYLGFEDTSKPSGINCIGTGFLVSFNNVGYLVTAKHVSVNFRDCPFVVRLNTKGGKGANVLPLEERTWVDHPDATVDLSAIVFESPAAYQSPYLHDTMILNDERMKQYDISVGCICYTTGLFRFVEGRDKNMPLTYTGNVVSLQLDDPYPVKNELTKKIEQYRVYLVQSHGLKGHSGSPVFVRQTKTIRYTDANTNENRSIIAPQNEIDVLGIFVGAWYFPPDAIIQDTYMTRENDNVPIGLGMVVPAQRIWELLQMPVFKPLQEKRLSQGAASPASVASLASDENPKHREDFTSLLKAASKTPPQGD